MAIEKSNKSKTNMEILNEIRDYRNSEISNLKRTDIYVTSVEFLGEGKQTNQKIFRLYEKQEFKDKPTQNFEKYYIYENDEPKLIAVKDIETEEIIPVGIDGNEQELWEEQKDDIEQCIEERTKQLEIIAKKLGISKEEIADLSEIDLEQKINEKSEEKEKNEDEPQEISEKQIKSIGGDAGNEVNLNAQIDTHGTRLGKTMGLDGYSSLVVVHSYKLSQLSNGNAERGNTKLALVGKKSDGTYETIPNNKLRPYRGSNTETTKIDNTEDVEMDNEQNIFEIPGSNKRLIIDNSGAYGVPNVYLAQNTHDNDGLVAQKVQDKYSGTDRTDVEVRELFNSNKGVYQTQKMNDEAEHHKEHGCDDLDIEEVDGDMNTGHIHQDDYQIDKDSIIIYQGKEMKASEVAELPRFKMSPEKFVDLYNQKLKDNEFDLEEIYDEIEDEANDYYPQMGR